MHHLRGLGLSVQALQHMRGTPMTDLWALDLFSGAGGCSAGYAAAGFTMLGVDLDREALKRYPYTSMEMDALQALDTLDLDRFAFIHASPPCQAYSVIRHRHGGDHPDLLGAVYQRLQVWGQSTGKPWVIENVPGAPFPPDAWVVEYCGAHLRTTDPDLGKPVRLRRHRLFSSNYPIMAPVCGCDDVQVAGVYGNGGPQGGVRTGYKPTPAVRRALMGIDWMTRGQLSQAIPPAYTRDIGEQIRGML